MASPAPRAQQAAFSLRGGTKRGRPQEHQVQPPPQRARKRAATTTRMTVDASLPTRVLTRRTAGRQDPWDVSVDAADALLAAAAADTDLPPALRTALPPGIQPQVRLATQPNPPARLGDIAALEITLEGLPCGPRQITVHRAYVRPDDAEARRAWAVAAALAYDLAAHPRSARSAAVLPRLLEALVLLAADREAMRAFQRDPETQALLAGEPLPLQQQQQQVRVKTQAQAGSPGSPGSRKRRADRPLDRHAPADEACARRPASASAAATTTSAAGGRLYVDALARLAHRHVTGGFEQGATVAILQEVDWMLQTLHDWLTPADRPVRPAPPPSDRYVRPSQALLQPPGARRKSQSQSQSQIQTQSQSQAQVQPLNVSSSHAAKLQTLAADLRAFRQPEALLALPTRAAVAARFADLRRAFLASVRSIGRLPRETRLAYGNVLQGTGKLSLQQAAPAAAAFVVKPQPQPQQARPGPAAGPTVKPQPQPQSWQPQPHPLAAFSRDALLHLDRHLARLGSPLRAALLRVLGTPPGQSLPPADALLLGHPDMQLYFQEVIAVESADPLWKVRGNGSRQGQAQQGQAQQGQAQAQGAIVQAANRRANANGAANANANTTVQALLRQFDRSLYTSPQSALQASFRKLNTGKPQDQDQAQAQAQRRLKGKAPVLPQAAPAAVRRPGFNASSNPNRPSSSYY
jgi:hypothetical protein